MNETEEKLTWLENIKVILIGLQIKGRVIYKKLEGNSYNPWYILQNSLDLLFNLIHLCPFTSNAPELFTYL